MGAIIARGNRLAQGNTESERVQPRVDRVFRAVEHGRVVHQLVVLVRRCAQGVELERDLRRVDRRVEFAGLLRLAHLPREEGEELACIVGHDLTHWALGAAVELGLDRVEEAAAGENLVR